MKPKYLSVFLFIFSCLPVKVAPKIDGDKLMVAKKFSRLLPNQYALVFEDPKEANEFYNFINTKYERNFIDVEHNVPFVLNKNTFYFSFYEIEKETKTANLVPIFVDAKRESNGNSSILNNAHTSRKGKWFLVLTASDFHSNDALNSNHPYALQIENYLRNLKNEYLNTSNYIESLLRKRENSN